VLLKNNKYIIGILNIYTPNHITARTTFWNQIANHNFLDAWWKGDDFNITQQAEDCNPKYTSKAIGGTEEVAWNKCCLTLGINDIMHLDEFRRIGTKYHTWSREKPNPI
jgi:hypothetical protein